MKWRPARCSTWNNCVIRFFVFIFLYSLANSQAFALTATGSPSNCTNDAAIGTVVWTTPTLAYSSNNAFAQAIVDGTTSQYLYCTGYNFALPADATIQGMTVNVERKSDRGPANGGSNDAAVRLIKGGVIGTANRATTTTYTATDTIEAHGGVADLWGTTWANTDINATNFGVAFATVKPSAGGQAHVVDVDHIQVVVTYVVTTTLADGANPGNATLAPGAAITDLDAFTLQTSSGTDSVTGLTVTLATGANTGLSEVRITSSDGATTYFSAASNPGSNIVTFSGGTPITATTTATSYKVRIIPMSHPNMPTPPGSSYTVTGTVTAFTSANVHAGTDNASATITIDNLSPSGATTVSGSAGDAKIALNWTTSASTDFSRSVILRWTGGVAGSEVPAEGTDYVTGDTIGTATVACVRTGDAASTAVSGTDGAGTGGCSATALANGQIYAYKIFQKDSSGNYDAGVTIESFIPSAPISSLDAVEAGAAKATPIYTKLAGTGFSLDILVLDSSGNLSTGYTGTVNVKLVDASSGACATMTELQDYGNYTFTATDKGRKAVNLSYANAAHNTRIRAYDASAGIMSCSTDNFAIRPTGFTVSSTDATNTGTSGTPVIKTGATFNLTAASVAGYNGTPAIDNTTGMVGGTPNAGAIGGAFAAALPATGTAAGNAFFYSEAGNFGLGANAVFDNTFTSIDQPNDCTADFSNALTGGKYGCNFGSTAVPLVIGSSGFGRFIPDNFNIAYNTPSFNSACGTFGYVGQTFSFSTTPVITVTARQGTANGLTNATTLNYAGSYMKLTSTSLAQAPYDTTAARYSRFDALGGGTTPLLDTSGLPSAATDPAIGTFTKGVGTLTFGAGAGLLFIRNLTVPTAPFDADITLTINVMDTDGVAFAGNPTTFGSATSGGGIAFNNGKAMRFGRLKLSNAHGSELLQLSIPIAFQYYTSNGWVSNTADSCSVINAGNFAFSSPGNNLAACETAITVSGSAPAYSLTLAAPGNSNNGWTGLTLNLGAAAAGSTCTAKNGGTGFSGLATTANMPWLQFPWGGAGATNPSARATFGVYKGGNEFIYLRERY